MSSQHKHRWKLQPGPKESTRPPTALSNAILSRRHLRFGWWSLWFFLALGLVLEALHGLKVGWYLDMTHTTRRHMWTLAHAHGTLLAMINLVLGTALSHQPAWKPRRPAWASACLLSGGMLLPAGFFLGGLRPYESDPGIGIVLVPVGGVLLLIAIFLVAAGRAD